MTKFFVRNTEELDAILELGEEKDEAGTVSLRKKSGKQRFRYDAGELCEPDTKTVKYISGKVRKRSKSTTKAFEEYNQKIRTEAETATTSLERRKNVYEVKIFKRVEFKKCELKIGNYH